MARDPLAINKLKVGSYAQAYFPTLEPVADPFAGDHLWLRVLSVDRDDGTWEGEVVTRPSSRCGVAVGARHTLSVEAAEQVADRPPGEARGP